MQAMSFSCSLESVLSCPSASVNVLPTDGTASLPCPTDPSFFQVSAQARPLHGGPSAVRSALVPLLSQQPSRTRYKDCQCIRFLCQTEGPLKAGAESWLCLELRMPRSETSRQKVLVMTMGKCIKGAKFYLPPLSVSPHLVLPLHPVLCLWEAQSSSFKCPTEARPQTSQGLEMFPPPPKTCSLLSKYQY